MFIRLNKKGQNTLEYAIVIAVIVAALIAMQNYIKRGVQGKMKQATDDIGEQYSPQNTNGSTTTTLSANSTENILGGPQPTTNSHTTQNQGRNTNENVAGLDQEWWPQ